MAPLFRGPIRAGHKKTAPRACGTVDVYSLASTQCPQSVGKVIKPRRRETVLSVTLHSSDCKAVTLESQIGVEAGVSLIYFFHLRKDDAD